MPAHWGTKDDTILDDLEEFAKSLPAQSEIVTAITLPRLPDAPVDVTEGDMLKLWGRPGEIEVRIDPDLKPGAHILHFADGSEELVVPA